MSFFNVYFPKTLLISCFNFCISTVVTVDFTTTVDLTG